MSEVRLARLNKLRIKVRHRYLAFLLLFYPPEEALVRAGYKDDRILLRKFDLLTKLAVNMAGETLKERAESLGMNRDYYLRNLKELIENPETPAQVKLQALDRLRQILEAGEEKSKNRIPLEE
jgi:hypothetical protein